MTPQIRHLISKKDRLLGENGAGVIIDEQVSYPGRPAQKKLLQPEKLSGDGRDIACTTQVVQGLAPSASTTVTRLLGCSGVPAQVSFRGPVDGGAAALATRCEVAERSTITVSRAARS